MNTCHSVFFVCVFLFHNRGRVAVALGMTSEHWAAALTHVTVSECSPAGVYCKLYFVSVLFNLFRMFSASCHRLLEGWNNCFRRKAPKNAFGVACWRWYFFKFILFKEKPNQAEMTPPHLFLLSVTGRHQTTTFSHGWLDCKEAAYLFSCPGSSCPPRSSWSAIRSEQPGTSCFRPTGWTPAAGPPPSRQPQPRSCTFLRETWANAADIHNEVPQAPPLSTGIRPARWRRHQSPDSFLSDLRKFPWMNPMICPLQVTVPASGSRRRHRPTTSRWFIPKHVFFRGPSLVTPAAFAFWTADWPTGLYRGTGRSDQIIFLWQMNVWPMNVSIEK